jgi:hypothetical protein
MNEKIDRPEDVEDEHLTYLDDLRVSGETNMWGAGAWLTDEFGITRRQASVILTYWMDSFVERHPR